MRLKARQRGYVALLVTSVILLLALIISLALSKSVFYQIKVAQNEVKMRKSHWKAEAGLECAYSINKLYKTTLPTDQDYSSCDLSTLTVTQSITNPEHFLVSSTADTVTLKKQIKVSGRTTGAIQARSDLKLMGSYTFTPEFVEPDTCISVRFQHKLSLAGGFVTKNPSGKTCKSSQLTDTQRPDLCVDGQAQCDDSRGVNDYRLTMDPEHESHYIGDEKMFEDDFVYDEFLDPFESFFGYPRGQIASVKSDFEVISGSTSNCQELIKNAFASKNQVWVTGDCDLKDGQKLSASVIGSSPKVLVIENGLLTANGTNVFPGMIYHLFTSDIKSIDMTSRWSNLSTSAFLTGLSTAEKSKLTFYSHGSFRPKGGYVFDTENGLSVFGSAVDLEFDAASIPNDIKKVSWVRGSWNDL